MRIYSDVLTLAHVNSAINMARAHGQDICLEDFEHKNGRKRSHSIELHCASFHGRRKQNRNYSDMPAASWKAWGFFITYLYNEDPNAIIGSYKSAEDFQQHCEKMTDWRKKYDGDNPTEFLGFLTSQKVEA